MKDLLEIILNNNNDDISHLCTVRAGGVLIVCLELCRPSGSTSHESLFPSFYRQDTETKGLRGSFIIMSPVRMALGSLASTLLSMARTTLLKAPQVWRNSQRLQFLPETMVLRRSFPGIDLFFFSRH